jgi:hypothetical protein
LIFTLPPLMRLTPRACVSTDAPLTITLPSRRKVMLASPHFRTTSSAPSSTTRPAALLEQGAQQDLALVGLDHPEHDGPRGITVLERQHHGSLRGHGMGQRRRVERERVARQNRPPDAHLAGP